MVRNICVDYEKRMLSYIRHKSRVMFRFQLLRYETPQEIDYGTDSVNIISRIARLPTQSESNYFVEYNSLDTDFKSDKFSWGEVEGLNGFRYKEFRVSEYCCRGSVICTNSLCRARIKTQTPYIESMPRRNNLFKQKKKNPGECPHCKHKMHHRYCSCEMSMQYESNDD